MWWTAFEHFGWVYCYTDALGRLVFTVEEFHEVLVSAQWAVLAPLMAQHLLRQHIDHLREHIMDNNMVACGICADQQRGLENFETYNASMDLAYVRAVGE